MRTQMLNLHPVLIVREFRAIHSFSKKNAAWEVNQAIIYWTKSPPALMLNLPPVLMMCEFWAIYSFSKENALYN